MKFDAPAGVNPADGARVLGQAHVRIDGPLKVCGKARYAYERHDIVAKPLVGVIVTAAIGAATIRTLDTLEAGQASGVRLVMTHRNAPPMIKGERGAPQLQGTAIGQAGQSIALVVADSFEQARAAAALIRAELIPVDGKFSLARAESGVPVAAAPDVDKGPWDEAFAAAPVTLDAVYATPDQSHAMMEPHAAMAVWNGDVVTVYLSHQALAVAHTALASTFGLPHDKVRMVSTFVGGGFGSKGEIYGDAVLAVAASRVLGRPVKIALRRPQIFDHTVHRAATVQHLRLACNRSGRLVAVGHDTRTGDQPGGNGELASEQSKLLYAADTFRIRTRVARLDLPRSGRMRAPGDAPGLIALESAVDELAAKAAIDPVAFRLLNDTSCDPVAGPKRPFCDRKLGQCLEDGAARFGWARRSARPLQVSDGRWWVGLGVAVGIRKNAVLPSEARVTLERGGRLLVETAMTDLGTGTYTIHAQIVAELMGVDIAGVAVRMGDSTLPGTAGSTGSRGATSSTAAIFVACMTLRRALAVKAGFAPERATFANSHVIAGKQSLALADLARDGPIAVQDGITYGDLASRFAQASFAAHFVETGVDRYTGEVRVRRMLTVASVGRVLNPITARSQIIGGMTMGIGSALMEALVVEPRGGGFLNHDLASYHVPVAADVPPLDVLLLEGADAASSPVKSRGLGELGICGSAAAIGNAVYNACGVRIRDFPITPDKIIAGLPPL